MLTIRVVNDSPARSTPSETTGFGLLGMRERAELVGGQLVTGPLPDGGWIVDLRLNRETI
jgi:signal transduction histidine kinase